MMIAYRLGSGGGIGWLAMVVILVPVGLATAALVKYMGTRTKRASDGLHNKSLDRGR
jgi:hypothetical protein